MGLAAAFRQGSVWTSERVRGYALVLLACELVAFAVCVAGTHGWIVPLEAPNSSDFVSFYAAGLLVGERTPALVYDHAAHYAREQQAVGAGIPYNFFYYPPVYLFVCAAIARLPYVTAFCVAQAGSLLSCLAVVRRIVGPVPLGALLAFPAVFWAVGTGQNALLTATLLGAATLTIDQRPVLAGVLMGALCYKPHLGLLLPIALAAGRHWRAFAAATATVLGLIAASALVFGSQTWIAFLESMNGIGAVYGTTDIRIDAAGLTNAYGLILALHGSPALAIGVQIIVTLGTAAAVAWVWAGPRPLAVRAAVLLAGIPVAAPIVLFYDLMVAGLAIAWLIHDGRDRGFAPWQKTGLMIAFVLPLFTGNLDNRLQRYTAPLTATLVFVLALRAVHQPRLRGALAP